MNDRRASVYALLIALMAVGLAAIAGCGRPQPDTAASRLPVVVSIIPQAWLARAVGGQRVQVTTLVAPGESHHTYQPTDAQVSQIMTAAVFFRLGTSFENAPWFQALEAAGKPRMVDLRQGVPLLDMVAHEDADEPEHTAAAGHGSEEGKDPHIWLSPRRLKIQAATMARAFGEADPAHRAEYEANLAAVQRQLDELDRSIAAKLAPLKGKSFFVFHPAWGYFADDYGLKQLAVEAEGKEPSDRQLTQLQQLARQAGVKVVFVQPQFAGRAAQAVAEAAGARLERADPLPADLPAGLMAVADALVASYR